MNKLTLAKALLFIIFILLMNFCPFRETPCEINERNRKKSICGVVVKSFENPKNHKFTEIWLDDKTVLYEATEYEEVAFASGVGDTICKPIGSLVFHIKPINVMFPERDISIELPCDSLQKSK